MSNEAQIRKLIDRGGMDDLHDDFELPKISPEDNHLIDIEELESGINDSDIEVDDLDDIINNTKC